MKPSCLFILPAAIIVCASCSSRIFSTCDGWSAPEYDRPCPTPPKAAYAACTGKKAGDAANYAVIPNFNNHNGETVNGICQADYQGRLALKPAAKPGADNEGT